MRKIKISIRLNPDINKQLEKLMQEVNLPKSKLIENSIDSQLNGKKKSVGHRFINTSK